MKVTAIVLAGGRGSRMEHRDKAWVNYNGKPLLLHVIDAIEDSVDDILISSGRRHPSYATIPWQQVADDDAHFLGPLSGIVSTVPLVESEFTLVVPCDIPNLPNDIVKVLARGIGHHDICTIHDGERLQQLVFLARTNVLQSSIADYLSEGKRSVFGWLESLDHSVVKLPESAEKFRNINELAQLADH